MASLIDDKSRDDFVADVREEYEEMRSDHYDGLKDRRYLSIAAAREKRAVLDWVNAPRPIAPSFLGTRVFDDYDLESLLPYIDWNPFFQVWQLRGKYPNRGYPKIFNDEAVGAEAKRVFNDAQEMLKMIIGKKLLRGVAIVGFYAANSVGDDIEVYEGEERAGKVLATFRGLRQQAEKDADNDEPYYCLSDFVAPKGSGVDDYIGLFATSAGFGVAELYEHYKGENDDYRCIMVQAVADRLAEALAEAIHRRVRVELWGYNPSEVLGHDDLLKVKYPGIRPAPGYPSQPDHREKATMWRLMKIKEQTGIELTESLAMMPAAAVSGLMFANEESRYFAVGKIGKDQVEEYAARGGVEETEKWLNSNLAYEC